MEPTSFFSGLASGLDYRALVDAIIAAESRPLDVLESRITEIQARSSVFVSYEGLLTAVRDSSTALRDASIFTSRTTALSQEGIVGASAALGADLGTHTVQVLQTAQTERLGGQSFQSDTTALGLSGEFFVNGSRVAVLAGDTLDDVAAAINLANQGTTPSSVSASVISVGANDHRIVLTSEETGAAGIRLADGASDVLRGLGFLDDTSSIQHATSDGALTEQFANATQAIGTILGMTPGTGAQTVNIGSFTASIDLDTMSLTDIANEINTKAAGAGSAVSAAVINESVDGQTVYRLDISGTTAFTDAGRTFEVLGVLGAGKSSVAHELQSGMALERSGGQPVNTNTRLRDVFIAGVDANFQDGDSFDISGTLGDGSAFSFSYAPDDGDRISDVLARLNSAVDGLQSGPRTATASLGADGRIVITDDQSGDSQVSLSIVSNNENGGTFDFGTFGTTATGRARVINAGADARLEVDGVFIQQSSNSVSDAVEGLTLDLLSASPGTVVTINVGRDTDKAIEAVQGLVQAFNTAATFVSEQVASPAEGEARGPLAGDSTMRSMALRMRQALQSAIAPGLAGGLTRLLDVGVELQQDGTFEVDATKLRNALEGDPTSVERLFGLYGTGSINEIEYQSASDATVAGNYALDVTQVATQALLTGIGFSGTYSDDATADTMTIKDVGSGAFYSILLQNGDDTQSIVDRINAEFGTELQEIHQAPLALHSDAVGTTAGASTLLQNVHSSGGVGAGIQTGDTINVSGTQRNGSSYSYDFVVGDPATQTLGDLVAAIQTQAGSETTISIDATGLITATDQKTGSSSFTLDITSDNAGGGSFSVGTVAATQEGRGQAGLQAVNNAGQIELVADTYGSAHGFEISYTAGGSDGSAQLGLAAGINAGLDVVGTIGGFAATGAGQVLTGDPNSDIEGLAIAYSGLTTGSVGSLTFSRGVASQLEQEINGLIRDQTGDIDLVVEQSATRVTSLEGRVDTLSDRLVRRRSILLSRFIAAEVAIASAQSQYSGLIASFGLNNNNDGS